MNYDNVHFGTLWCFGSVREVVVRKLRCGWGTFLSGNFTRVLSRDVDQTLADLMDALAAL